jgi:hypothetical protein
MNENESVLREIGSICRRGKGGERRRSRQVEVYEERLEREARERRERERGARIRK